jgi:DNA-binding transcriptional MerR regulator
VQERTGYRFYSLDQQQRGIWVRRLRDAGLRLDRIHRVLESSPADAEAVLDDWLAELERADPDPDALAARLRAAAEAVRPADEAS